MTFTDFALMGLLFSMAVRSDFKQLLVAIFFSFIWFVIIKTARDVHPPSRKR